MPSNHTPIVTYTERFVHGLATLCRVSPPTIMCRAWLRSSNEELQSWVSDHQHCLWATAIGTIDAARILADSTDEGRPELVTHRVEMVLEHVTSAPIQLRRRGQSRWLADPLPAGLSQKDVEEAIRSDVTVVQRTGNSTATMTISDAFCFA